MYFIWIKLLEQYQITSQLLRKTLKDIPSRSWYFDECHNDAQLCTSGAANVNGETFKI